MVVIDSRNMVVEQNCGHWDGPITQTAPQKRVTLTSETKKTPEHSEEYYRAVAILEARAEEKRLDSIGVPSVEEIAASLGVSVEELKGSPGLSAEEPTEEQIEAMLPSLSQIKKDFGIVSEDNKKPEPSKRAVEQSDEIPTVEEIARQLGIKI